VNAAPPSLRATPPLAMPRCLAIFRPPARKLDHVLARTEANAPPHQEPCAPVRRRIG
jgi:hypothetical protein